MLLMVAVCTHVDVKKTCLLAAHACVVLIAHGCFHVSIRTEMSALTTVRTLTAAPHPTDAYRYVLLVSICMSTPLLLHGCLDLSPEPTCSNWTVVTVGPGPTLGSLSDMAVVAALTLPPTAAQTLGSDGAWLGVAASHGTPSPFPVVMTYRVDDGATRLAVTRLADDVCVGGVVGLAGGGAPDAWLLAAEGVMHVACVLDKLLANEDHTGVEGWCVCLVFKFIFVNDTCMCRVEANENKTLQP